MVHTVWTSFSDISRPRMTPQIEVFIKEPYILSGKTEYLTLKDRVLSPTSHLYLKMSIYSFNSKFEWLHNELHNDLHNDLHNKLNIIFRKYTKVIVSMISSITCQKRRNKNPENDQARLEPYCHSCLLHAKSSEQFFFLCFAMPYFF